MKGAKAGYILAFLSAFGFSFKSILVKVAYGYGVDPLTIMLMRMFMALPFFIIALILMEGRHALTIRIKEVYIFAIMGIVGIGIAMLFSFYSIQHIGASLATLVVFTYPAITVMMLFLLFGEEMAPLRVLSLCVTFLGLAMVVGIDDVGRLMTNINGVVFALVSAFSYAIYNVMSQRVVRDIPPIRVVSWCMIFLVGFFVFLFGDRTYPEDYTVWGIAFLLGFFSGFLPFVFFIYAVREIGAGRAVIVSSTGPVFTVLWAYIFLGENLETVQITGMVLIITGVALLKAR